MCIFSVEMNKKHVSHTFSWVDDYKSFAVWVCTPSVTQGLYVLGDPSRLPSM